MIRINKIGGQKGEITEICKISDKKIKNLIVDDYMKKNEMRIIDMKNMPNFNPAVKNGIDSVSSDKVYLKDEYPHCKNHGALLKVSPNGIWRCPACNEGCYEVE